MASMGLLAIRPLIEDGQDKKVAVRPENGEGGEGERTDHVVRVRLRSEGLSPLKKSKDDCYS